MNDLLNNIDSTLKSMNDIFKDPIIAEHPQRRERLQLMRWHLEVLSCDLKKWESQKDRVLGGWKYERKEKDS